MARLASSRLLDSGDPFPDLELTLTDGRRMQIPRDLTQPYNVVLITRGAWCPYCVAQLGAFQSGLPRLAEAQIGVVSFSTDSADDAAKLVAEKGLRFPVGHGASVTAVAEALGAYFDPRPAHVAPYLHSTGFVLGPGARVLTAVYSSGAIGRLAWQDVLGLVSYARSHR